MTTLLTSIQRRLSLNNQDNVEAPLYDINVSIQGTAISYQLHQQKTNSDIPSISKLTSLKDLFPKKLESRKILEKADKHEKQKRKIAEVTHSDKVYTISQSKKSRKRRRKSQGSTIVDEKIESLFAKEYRPKEQTVKEALEKSIEQESFWSVETVKILLENDFIPSHLQGLLCDCLLKYNSLELLNLLPRNYLEEKYILKCLKSILSEVLVKEKINGGSSSKHIVDEQYALNLYIVLAQTYEEDVMQNYLKLLTTDESIVLFQFLHLTVKVVSPALLYKADISQIPDNITEAMVMSWISCLITAKLTVFMSSSVLQKIMLQFMSTMRKQGFFYQHISTLRPYLNQLQNGLKLPKKKIGRYQIETITL